MYLLEFQIEVLTEGLLGVVVVFYAAFITLFVVDLLWQMRPWKKK